MANEINVQATVRIKKGYLEYQNYPVSFQADMTGSKGPTPGALTIPVGGKVISFAELTTPGICVLTNIDSANYVSYGIRDPDTNKFYPLGELLPGEAFPLRLSRDLQEEYAGTGTSTTSPGNQFFMKANTADVKVKVEAFEK